MEELFEKIEDNYLVSNLGRVLNIKREIFMKTRLDKQGYEVLVLHVNGQSVNYSVHRLVATMFVPNPFNLPQVNHINGLKADNVFTNLEWVTSSQNNQHAFDVNLRKSGEEHYKAKLSKENVIMIRELLSEGLSHRYISTLFPVGRSTISKIAKGEIWKHD